MELQRVNHEGGGAPSPADVLFRVLTCSCFKSACEVFTCWSGNAACDQVTAGVIDVAIAMIMLPRAPAV